MLRLILISILCIVVTSKRKSEDAPNDLGGNLVTALRNDANLDLSVDEDYEDLRAELLAYHTALAALTSGRRSMKSTPCWQLGGICVDHKLCEGHRSLSEVPGCKDNLEVCCFTWNKFQVRDMRDKDIGVLAMPWSLQKEIGGRGVIGPDSVSNEKLNEFSPPHDRNKVGHKAKTTRAPHIHEMHHLETPQPISIQSRFKKGKGSHHGKSHHKKPPLLVILRTK